MLLEISIFTPYSYNLTSYSISGFPALWFSLTFSIMVVGIALGLIHYASDFEQTRCLVPIELVSTYFCTRY